jgi:hypothetical protein
MHPNEYVNGFFDVLCSEIYLPRKFAGKKRV